MKNLFIILIIILYISLIGCSKDNVKTENIEKLKQTKVTMEQNITQEDINEAKQVVRNYFEAVKTKDMKKIEKTIDRFVQKSFDEGDLKQWQSELHVIEYPGKYTVPDHEYKVKDGKTLYKYLSLHVYLENNQDMDFFLVKETEQSSWLINRWGSWG